MADEVELTRARRYTESCDLPEIFKSKFLNQFRHYYNGELLDKRMRDIREAIIYIRENWTHYSEFMQELKDLFKGTDCSSAAKKLFEVLLHTNKNWIDVTDVTTHDNLEAIRLYTSVDGYDYIYSVINRIFRHDDAIKDETLIRTVVFLVELINIDLYNYCYSKPEYSNFCGIVYRGLALSTVDLNAFETLMKRGVSERCIAVPLGLMSSSTKIEIAETFFLKRSLDDSVPVILKIHVINMKDEYLSLYKETYTSVVSTICAVDIKDLSEFPEENEVLLRGPFFQVLRIYDGDIIGEKQSRVVEMVIVNSNRDHISTMQLGDKSNDAREKFGAMVTITRCEFAVQFCTQNGLMDDLDQYTSIIKQKKQVLNGDHTE